MGRVKLLKDRPEHLKSQQEKKIQWPEQEEDEDEDHHWIDLSKRDSQEPDGRQAVEAVQVQAGEGEQRWKNLYNRLT